MIESARVSTTRLFSAFGFVVLTVFSVVFVPMVGQGQLPSVPVLVSFGFNGLLFNAALAYSLARRPVSFATMIGYFGVWFLVLVPCVQAGTGEWKWINSGTGVRDADIIFCNSMVAVAYGIVVFAYRWAYRRGERVRSAAPLLVYEWKPAPLVFLLVIFLVLAVVYASSLGGFSGIVSRSARGAAAGIQVGEQSGARSILVMGNNIMRPGVAFLALAVFFLAKFRPDGPLDISGDWKRYLLLSVVLLLSAVILNAPIGVARYYLVPVGFVAMALLMRNQRLAMVAIFVFLFGGVYMSSVFHSLRSDIRAAGGIFDFDREYFFEGHFNSWETILLNISWVSRDGFSYGIELLGAVLFWVPRAIWESKPESASVAFSTLFLSQLFDFDIHNVGVSTLGTFYRSFGVIGVVLYGLVTGGVAGFMDGRYHDDRFSLRTVRERLRFSFPSVSYHPFMAGAFFIFLRGQVWVGFQFLFSVTVTYLLVSWIALKKTPVEYADGRWCRRS